MKTRALTFAEVMVTIAILMILAGLLLPVLSGAKQAAKATTCISNLGQSVRAIELYLIDFDGTYPNAVDSFIKPYCAVMATDVVSCLNGQRIQDLVAPYAGPMVFACPLDRGLRVVDFLQFPSVQSPTCFSSSGSSYWYNEVLAIKKATSTSLWNPSLAAVLSDRTGAWHGGKPINSDSTQNPNFLRLYRGFRYNTAFADGHVKSLTPRQLNTAKGAVFHNGDWILNIRLP